MYVFIKNINNNIIMINNDINSLRCRQRGVKIDGSKVKPLKFVSYRSAYKNMVKGNQVYGPFKYNTVSRL